MARWLSKFLNELRCTEDFFMSFARDFLSSPVSELQRTRGISTQQSAAAMRESAHHSLSLSEYIQGQPQKLSKNSATLLYAGGVISSLLIEAIKLKQIKGSALVIF